MSLSSNLLLFYLLEKKHSQGNFGDLVAKAVNVGTLLYFLIHSFNKEVPLQQ
mgnify:CR=1 FL=1